MDQLFVGIGIGVISWIGILVVLISVYLVIRKNTSLQKVKEFNSKNKELNEHKYILEYYSLDKPRTKIKPKKMYFYIQMKMEKMIHFSQKRMNQIFQP